MTQSADIAIGFIPLLDSATLIAADVLGFCREQHIEVQLVRQASWSNIRDRLAVGHLQAAHMLAPMAIASNLGLYPLSLPVIAPIALGLGGNAVTVSNSLHREMTDMGMADDLDPAEAGRSLKAVIASRRQAGRAPLRFAVVYPFSSHNYEFRYWLSACGIDPDLDLDLSIVPPPLMAEQLDSGGIDGFCVGEPYNSVAVQRGVGQIITVKSKIWRNSPEKVLGMADAFAEANPDATDALVRAIYNAARWCSDPGNHAELAGILARREWLDIDADLLMPALTGLLRRGRGSSSVVDDFFLPHAKAANFPWQSQALWFYSQMVRWGHVTHDTVNKEAARMTFRPDIYRRALAKMAVAMPTASMKVEGALAAPQYVGAENGPLLLGPDGFFDHRRFDPELLDDYILDNYHNNAQIY
ncbi:MAG: CmpA/NrtA family ABC transporter substrate-binding protein [Allorhizobium sp.]